MKQIPLTQGKFAIVDDEDFSYLSRFQWFAAESKGDYYARRKIRTVNVKGVALGEVYLTMDSILIPPKPYSVIAHKNKDTLDYRKENLFYESYSVKRHRADKKAGKTSSRHKGVCYWAKGKKHWTSCIYKRDEESDTLKRFFIGYFMTEKEAALAYNEKARELYGEDAYQNEV